MPVPSQKFSHPGCDGRVFASGGGNPGGITIEPGSVNGYVFQVEMAYLAHRLRFSFREIPIYFAERQRKNRNVFPHQAEAGLVVAGSLCAICIP